MIEENEDGGRCTTKSSPHTTHGDLVGIEDLPGGGARPHHVDDGTEVGGAEDDDQQGRNPGDRSQRGEVDREGVREARLDHGPERYPCEGRENIIGTFGRRGRPSRIDDGGGATPQ